jgi:hypothetical protein
LHHVWYISAFDASSSFLSFSFLYSFSFPQILTFNTSHFFFSKKKNFINVIMSSTAPPQESILARMNLLPQEQDAVKQVIAQTKKSTMSSVRQKIN